MRQRFRDGMARAGRWGATVIGVAVVGLLLMPSAVHAATTYNDQGTGNWSSAGTWTPGGGPPVAADTAVIDSHTVTADTPNPITVANLTVGSGTTGAGVLNVQQNVTVTGELRLVGRDTYNIIGDGTHKIGAVDLLWDGRGSSGFATSIGAGAIIEASGVNSRLGTAMDRHPTLDGTVRILSGGVFDYKHASRNLNGSGQFFVDSGATFKKTGASSTTSIAPAFTNNGTVLLVSDGLGLVLAGDRSSSGNWQVESGATLALHYVGADVTHSGDFAAAGSVTLRSGNGFVKTISGSYNVGGTTTIASAGTGVGSGGTVLFENPATFGNLTTVRNNTTGLQLGAGTHTVTGAFRLGYGGAAGAGIEQTTLNVGDFIIDSQMTVGKTLLSGLTLNVGGANSAYYYGDRTPVGIDAAVNLLSGAAFDLQQEANRPLGGDGVWTAMPGATLKKATGSGTSLFAGFFVNAGGTVSAESGLVHFNTSNRFSQTAGLTVLDGGSIQIAGTAVFTGGTIAGTGTLTATVNATGAGTGLTISPGQSAGHLTVTGATTLDANDTIAIELGGYNPGVDTDLLTVNGTLTLGGATIHGSLLGTFAPLDSDSITVIQATAISGAPGGTSTPTHIVPPGTSLADYQATYGIALADFTATVTGGNSVVLSEFDLYPYVDIVLGNLGGGLYQLDASGSYDPDDDLGVPSMTFAWDLGGTGLFAAGTGATLALPGPGHYTVGIRVTDNDSTMTELLGLTYTIPEPSSLLLAMLGVAALGLRRGTRGA